MNKNEEITKEITKEICKFMGPEELVNELVRQAEEYEIQCQKEFAIKELESIQEEIQNHFNNFKFAYWTADSITRLLGEHITKLKGE